MENAFLEIGKQVPALAVLCVLVWVFVKDRATMMHAFVEEVKAAESRLIALNDQQRNETARVMNQVEKIADNAHQRASESYTKLSTAIDALRSVVHPLQQVTRENR